MTLNPRKEIQMRGDGNRLFRALSNTLLAHKHTCTMLWIEATFWNIWNLIQQTFFHCREKKCQQNIEHLKLGKCGTWGTEVEICALVTMMVTCVYVYGQNLSKSGRSCYSPIAKPSKFNSVCNVYLQNVYTHFEPVFEDRCIPCGQPWRRRNVEKHWILQHYISQTFHKGS